MVSKVFQGLHTLGTHDPSPPPGTPHPQFVMPAGSCSFGRVQGKEQRAGLGKGEDGGIFNRKCRETALV